MKRLVNLMIDGFFQAIGFVLCLYLVIHFHLLALP
jgi:hypothetical protein